MKLFSLSAGMVASRTMFPWRRRIHVQHETTQKLAFPRLLESKDTQLAPSACTRLRDSLTRDMMDAIDGQTVVHCPLLSAAMGGDAGPHSNVWTESRC